MSAESEVLTKIRDTLKADSTLLGYVDNDANNIRHSYANAQFDTPVITYHTVIMPPDSDMDRYGKFEMRLQFNIFGINNSTDITNIRNIYERIDALLYEQVFATTNYKVKNIRHSGWQWVPTDYIKEGEAILHCFAEWTLNIYKIEI